MRILGYDYTIRRDVSANNSDVAAMCNSRKLEIILPVGDDKPQLEESAVLHEIIEALDYHLQLELQHRVIMALEAGLFQVLSANGVDLSPLLAEMDKPK